MGEKSVSMEKTEKIQDTISKYWKSKTYIFEICSLSIVVQSSSLNNDLFGMLICSKI